MSAIQTNFFLFNKGNVVSQIDLLLPHIPNIFLTKNFQKYIRNSCRGGLIIFGFTKGENLLLRPIFLR